MRLKLLSYSDNQSSIISYYYFKCCFHFRYVNDHIFLHAMCSKKDVLFFFWEGRIKQPPPPIKNSQKHPQNQTNRFSPELWLQRADTEPNFLLTHPSFCAQPEAQTCSSCC